jgi:hypothetical protein
MLATAGSLIMTNTKFVSTDQWHRFTLATFAIGTNGADVYFFSPSPTADPDLPDHYQTQAAALGSPTGAYFNVGAAYARYFHSGEAVANPSNTTVTVNLPRAMTDLNGNVVSSVTLPPQSGDLLRD